MSYVIRLIVVEVSKFNQLATFISKAQHMMHKTHAFVKKKENYEKENSFEKEPPHRMPLKFTSNEMPELNHDSFKFGTKTYQIFVQILADIRCYFHHTDEYEKYSQQNR